MKKNQSLIVVDMQDEFLGVNTKYPDFYIPRRELLIERIGEKVEAAISSGILVLNIAFGDSPIVKELQGLLNNPRVRQFRKKSDGLFPSTRFRYLLDGDIRRRILIESDKGEYNSIFPKKGISGFPIKEILLRGGTCSIAGVSTTECVLAVNEDLEYLRQRTGLRASFLVLGDLCMTSNPQISGGEVAKKEIDKIYKYYGLNPPKWLMT